MASYASPSYDPSLPLSLKKPLVDEFWERRDARTKMVLAWMHGAEHWTMDEKPSLQPALIVLAEQLQRARAEHLQRAQDLLIKTMAYLSAPTFFRLCAWMEHRFNTRVDMLGGLVHHAAHLRDHPTSTNFHVEGALFIERFHAIKSVPLMMQIFHPERLQYLRQLLEKYPSI